MEIDILRNFLRKLFQNSVSVAEWISNAYFMVLFMIFFTTLS